MQSARNLGRVPQVSILRPGRDACLPTLLFFLAALSGCGMPGAPQPPSLDLPNRVTDLSAVRAGNRVALTWTMPKRTTDKVTLTAPITVDICRKENNSASCTIATTLQLAPASDGAFTDTLPPALAAGSPRPLTYFVELVNRKGRSAGLSNAAEILAGQAPSAIVGLRADVRKDGVLLSWAPAPPDSPSAAVRLERTLLTPPAKKPAQGPTSAPPEPAERNLLVDPGASGQALDRDIRFGETYEYRAQRVLRITENGQTLELAGPPSAPTRIDVVNVFPPAVPQGLAAVATAGENGNAPAIDLSWQPVTDADLAGYIVYRREPSATSDNSSASQRISPAQPPTQLIVGPGFHDPNVQPGHTYAYAVSAIGQNGRESARSAEAQEVVPQP
jgi:hypothetical protein